jgi:hypothetical protein
LFAEHCLHGGNMGAGQRLAQEILHRLSSHRAMRHAAGILQAFLAPLLNLVGLELTDGGEGLVVFLADLVCDHPIEPVTTRDQRQSDGPENRHRHAPHSARARQR